MVLSLAHEHNAAPLRRYRDENKLQFWQSTAQTPQRRLPTRDPPSPRPDVKPKNLERRNSSLTGPASRWPRGVGLFSTIILTLPADGASADSSLSTRVAVEYQQ
jgi:hypothetical protein